MTKFIYNPKTCRYERERLNLLRTSGLAILVAILAALFFVAIAFIHSIVWESEEETRLKAENAALDRNYALVKQQYVESEEKLKLLDEKDKALKASLFNTIFVESNSEQQKQRTSYIAINSLSKLRNGIEELTARTHELKDDANFNSYYFSNKLSGDRKSILEKLSRTPSILPVNNGKLISGFGKRIHPFHKGLYDHTGIDLTAPRGTAIVAAADGVVSDISNSTLLAGYGNLVEISHNEEMTTRYAHLESILVKQGQKVKKGQVIGTLGNSGGSITPHLHYEVLKNGVEQNPMHYLLQNIDPAEYQQLLTISTKQNQALD